MKKSLLMSGLLFFFLSSFAFAQDLENEGNGFATWTFDLNVSALDFYSPKLEKFSSFKEKMAIGPDFSATRHWSKTGLGLSANVLSPSVSFLKGNGHDIDINKYVVMFGPGLVYNFQNEYLIKAKSPVAPFIFADALATVAQVNDLGGKSRFGFGVPLGAGLYFKLADRVGLNVKAGYAFGVTDYADDYIFWSTGATLGLPKGKIAEAPVEFLPVDTDGDGIPDEIDDCPDIPGLVEFNGCPDTDGDGIPDYLDDCPDVPGLAEFSGCPDTDGDGIPDHLDECPEVAGLAQFKGCPDTDGDGIPDHLDECPEVAGPAENNGCPWPDRDGDGVPDHLDKCPDEAGPVENQGCPEVEEEVKEKLQQIGGAVQFEIGKASIKKSSEKLLDEVVEILNNYPAYKVSVEGHTDNTGSEALNEKLSADRAKVCADYLISKGISEDRVSSVGFGPRVPIADNNTAEGRAKNRRTEFKLSLK